MRQDDGRAVVRTRCGGPERVLLVDCSADLRLVVPADVQVLVRADVDGVRLEGLDGPLRAESSAGSVRLVDVGGPVVASSSAGGVRGERLRSTDVEAESSAGAVRLGFDVPPRQVRAGSSAGAVEVVLPAGSGPYAVDASSSAGSTDVDVPTDPSAERRVEARSSAGSVVVREAPA